MNKKNIDDLFREKINQINDLPINSKWSKTFGWDGYQKKYKNPHMISKKMLIYLSSAAAAIIFISIFFINNDASGKMVSVSNNTGKSKEVKLPCGNSVWLNNKSSVEFSSKIDTDEFQVTINGEVYVEINNLKSKHYIIRSHNAVVKLEVPASFNIRGYANEQSIDVTVNSGMVKVLEENYEEGLELLVTNGNYCSVHKSQKLVFATANSNQNFMAWKTGEFIFNNTPMETVAEVLAQYYGTEIDLLDNNLAYCKFSGTFGIQNMDLILNQIKSDLKLEILNAGKKITISGQGCL